MTETIQPPYYVNFDLEIIPLPVLNPAELNLKGLPWYQVILSPAENLGDCQPKRVVLELNQSSLAKFHEAIVANRLYANSDESIRHDTNQAQIIGQNLYDFLINAGDEIESGTPSDMRDVFNAAARKVLEAKRGVRFRLKLGSPELQNYPWEYIFDSARAEFLGLNHQYALVRYIKHKDPHQVPSLPEKVRMLGLVGADLPNTSRPRREKWLAEMQRLKGVLQLKRSDFEFVIEPDLTAEELDDYLRENQFNIIHYFGHGDFDEKGSKPQGYLILPAKKGVKHFYGSDLKISLSKQENLALVSLYACHTAATRNGDRFSSVAASLNSVPAVTAMQFAANDSIANLQCESFYTALLSGESVEQAMCRARGKVYQLSNQLDFGIQALYCRTQEPLQLFSKLPLTVTPEMLPAPAVTSSSPADGETLLYLIEAQLNEFLSQLENGNPNLTTIKNKLKEYVRLAGMQQNIEVGEIKAAEAPSLTVLAPANPDLYRLEAEALVAQGNEFYARGGDQYYAAVGLFQIASGKDKENVEAWLGLGRAQLKLEKGPAALVSLQQAFKLASQRLEICLELAEAYRLMGNELESLKYLDRAISLQPKQPIAYSRRGDYYYADHEWELAAHFYTTAIKYKSKDLEIRLKRANCYYSMPNLREAFEDYRYYYEKSLDKDSENCRLALARVQELFNRIYRVV